MSKKYVNPRIKPINPIYKLNENEFRIGAQLGITAEFNDPDGELWELVNQLNGRELTEVTKNVRLKYPHLSDEDVLGGIALLDDEGFIEETLKYEENNIPKRYIPNINYFSRYVGTEQNRYEMQKKINDTTILLLGLGGGGSNILTLLAGLGPKKIIIVDYDIVEEGNLGRQLLYREADIGNLKTDVAVKAISEINSLIELEAHNKKIQSVEDVLALTPEVDLVICAIDEPPFAAQRIVNEGIVKANLPCVFAASQVSRGRVFSVLPKRTGCFDCLNIHYSKQDPQFVEQFLSFRNIQFDPPSIAYAPAIFQLTAAIADEVIRIITGYAPPRSISTQYEINFEDGTSFTHPTWERCEAECPTCGKGEASNWEIFQYYDN